MQSQSRTAMILVMFCCGKILTFEKPFGFLGVPWDPGVGPGVGPCGPGVGPIS